MRISRPSFLSNRVSSPPKAQAKGLQQTTDVLDLSAAQPADKSGVCWGKLAVGLGLVGGALTGCTDGGEPVPPSADPGEYVLETPELVLMSNTTARIDIARETEQNCTGIGEDSTCTTDDVPYHRLGVQVGHGIIQDLNGNLFAAPQLATDVAPGVAVSNPDSVTWQVQGREDIQGQITRTDQNTFHTGGFPFGRSDITIQGNTLTQTRTRILAKAYTALTVSLSDNVATVKEVGYPVALVQSQGDHLLVQSKGGRTLAEIRHDKQGGNYQVSRPGSRWTTTATYTNDSISLQRGNRQSDTTTRNADGSFITKSYPTENGETTQVDSKGWTEKRDGLFGGREYRINFTGGFRQLGAQQ